MTLPSHTHESIKSPVKPNFGPRVDRRPFIAEPTPAPIHPSYSYSTWPTSRVSSNTADYSINRWCVASWLPVIANLVDASERASPSSLYEVE